MDKATVTAHVQSQPISVSQYTAEKGLNLHPVTLQFSGKRAALEELFQEDYYNNYLGLFRICHLFSIFFYGCFALVDITVFQDQTDVLLFIRFGVVVPVFLIGYLFTYHRLYRRLWKVLNNLYIVLTGAGFLAMVAYCPPPLNYTYYVGVIVCLFFGYTFIRSHLIYASAAGLVLVLGYVVTAIMAGISDHHFIIQLSFLLTANFLGMLICCSAEISARKDFYLRYLLQEERKRVEEINSRLEQLVAERTDKLSESNRQLTREMEERKKLESRLVQSQKMEAIGTLAGGIAHDFNNILTAIIGYTDLARESCEPGMSEVRDDLDKVLAGANRARELVKQILTFSRRGEKELKPVRFQIIVKEALKLLRSTIPATIEISSEIEADCPQILADPTELHQVVMNLCTNAYQAMKECGGKLHIILRRHALTDDVLSDNSPENRSYILFSVQDTGVGMSRDVIDRIFEPYFTSKALGEGTGLGLAVVHGIVQACEGKITVESEPGKGSVFNLYFPQAPANGSRHSVNTDSTRDLLGGSESILLVDDDPAIADVTCRSLEKYGYNVTPFTSSSDAFDNFQEDPLQYDLLLTDMTMPEMTGVELAVKLKNIRPGFPVVLCTGYSDVVDEDSAGEMGIDFYLTKPVIRMEMLLTIRKALDK